MENRYAFIVPGCPHAVSSRNYQWVGREYAKQGIEPIYVQPPWSRKTRYWEDAFPRSVAQALQEFPGEQYVFGFSWGALASVLATKRHHVKHQLLCSLSPEIKEFRPLLEQELLRYRAAETVSEKEFETMPLRTFTQLKRSVSSPTTLLLGSKELLTMHLIGDRLSSEHAQTQFRLVRGAEHDIGDPRYQRAIRAEIRKL